MVPLFAVRVVVVRSISAPPSAPASIRANDARVRIAPARVLLSRKSRVGKQIGANLVDRAASSPGLRHGDLDSFPDSRPLRRGSFLTSPGPAGGNEDGHNPRRGRGNLYWAAADNPDEGYKKMTPPLFRPRPAKHPARAPARAYGVQEVQEMAGGAVDQVLSAVRHLLP